MTFEYYQSGYLHYSTSVDPSFIFPVPISDTGEAAFNKEDKGMYFMRYIQKYIKELKESKN